MKPEKLLAIISRDFLQEQNVYQYRMKKIADMDDNEVVQKCHWYYEENGLNQEWKEYRQKAESKYRYCAYLEEFIDNELCYDMQMITEDYIKSSVLPEIKIDKEKCAKFCFECIYKL